MKAQISIKTILIGCLGCVLITASSCYSALKMGALPWPTVFAAIISMWALKLFKDTRTCQINVCHTIMSAGSMVAGGLAFTIPALWILDPSHVLNFTQVLLVALLGVALGLAYSGTLRKRFIEQEKLEYPLGIAAANCIKTSTSSKNISVKLFSSMGLAAAFTFIRDQLLLIPTILFSSTALPGVAFGIYASPLMASIGFLVGGFSILFMIIGSFFSAFAINAIPISLGLSTAENSSVIASSLGMGCMLGAGLLIVLKTIFLFVKSSVLGAQHASNKPAGRAEHTKPIFKKCGFAGLAAISLAVIVAIICCALNMSVIASVFFVLLTWIAVAMAAQCVGRTGIDPMEVFALLCVLIIMIFFDIHLSSALLLAAIISVACGFTGDTLNDFKAGYIFATKPKLQYIGQALGGIIGAIIASATILLLFHSYGAESFGPGEFFVSAQASMLASMISGIPSMEFFILGLVVGALLSILKLPSLMLGLGIYLPFYLSAAAGVGALIAFAYKKISKPKSDEGAYTVASGIIGGESIAGVLIALGALLLR